MAKIIITKADILLIKQLRALPSIEQLGIPPFPRLPERQEPLLNGITKDESNIADEITIKKRWELTKYFASCETMDQHY